MLDSKVAFISSWKRNFVVHFHRFFLFFLPVYSFQDRYHYFMQHRACLEIVFNLTFEKAYLFPIQGLWILFHSYMVDIDVF